MAPAGPSARDTAVTTMRMTSAGVAIAGLTLTGGVAGLFAREMAPTEQAAASARRDTSPSRVVVVVHDKTAGGGPVAAEPAQLAPAAPAPAPAAPAPAPTVSAPAEPTAPAASSSGSDPS